MALQTSCPTSLAHYSKTRLSPTIRSDRPMLSIGFPGASHGLAWVRWTQGGCKIPLPIFPSCHLQHP
jgi:hypothetical protein